ELKANKEKADKKSQDAQKILIEASSEELDLVSNIDLKKSDEKISQLEEQQKALQAQLGAEDMPSLLRAKKQLSDKYQQLKEKNQIAISCMAPVEREMKEKRAEMKAKKFEGIHDKYSWALIDIATQRTVADDLNKYVYFNG